jgi:voltage-gated potassium channel
VVVRTSATAVAPGAERPDVVEIENPVLLWLRRGFTEPGTRPYFYVVGTQLALIALSIILIILESIKTINAQFGDILRALEAVLLVGFLAEYALSIAFAPDKRAYLFSFWGIVDFLAIVPSLLTGVTVNLAELRVVRLLRVLRAIRVIKLAKLARRSPDETGRPAPRTMRDDWILYGITAFCVVMISGTVVYYVEGENTPEAFPDIPTSMWWAWLIITSAGQDAIMPVTTSGRVLAVLTLFAGLAQFAMLISVVARQLQRLRQDEERVRMAAQRAAQRMMILMPRKSEPRQRKPPPAAS